jgi:hypothetical protein
MLMEGTTYSCPHSQGEGVAEMQDFAATVQ